MIFAKTQIAMGLAGLAFVGSAYAMGRVHGHERGFADGSQARSIQVVEARAWARKLMVERDQARAEVTKVNEAVAQQTAAILERLDADSTLREEAQRRVERAARQAAQEARQAAERSQQAREVIENVADECARAGVPQSVLGVLNDIVAGGDTRAAPNAGDGVLSASQSVD